jgi:Ca2+-binding RTX toxin-like protein
MSDTATLPGGISPANFSNASGSTDSFSSYFPTGVSFTPITDSGETTATGPVVIALSGVAVTVSASNLVDDASSGSNLITLTTPSVLFASANDTLSAASGATTLFGATLGQMSFNLGGSNNSVTGGSGSLVGSAATSNSTLIGGGGINLFTITGSNNLVVAGQGGSNSGYDLSQTNGPETLSTNPLGSSGMMVATLGGGAQTVIGGGGASTITAGSGNDVFAFVNGHSGGSEVIIGYNAKDNIAFAGYGYSGANLPTETVTSAGDVISLNDGTTITLAGLDHKIFTNS